MKVKSYISLHSDMCTKTQFKNTLTNYTNSETLTKILVLLLVDWDKNGLQFTKRLHMMNMFIGYS